MNEVKLEEAKDLIKEIYDEFIYDDSDNIGDIKLDKQTIIDLNNLLNHSELISFTEAPDNTFNGFTSYDNEPIGGGNPYYRCCSCGRSDPEINGNLLNHDEDCSYREIELKKLGFK